MYQLSTHLPTLWERNWAKRISIHLMTRQRIYSGQLCDQWQYVLWRPNSTRVSLFGTGAMFVGAQKKLPKKERGRKEKGEDYIISHLIKSSLIENHYKNGWNSVVYYYRLLMSFDSLISHMENWDVCYLSLCNPFCCMMHMHLGSCLLTPFLDIYQ